jgi:hypothetical protein
MHLSDGAQVPRHRPAGGSLQPTRALQPTIIEGWIRKRLPRGSPDAYSDDALDAFSRELGGGRAFKPYGSPLEMRWPSQ